MNRDQVQPDQTPLVYIKVSTVQIPMITVQRFQSEHSRCNLRTKSVEHSTKRHAAFVNVFVGIFQPNGPAEVQCDFLPRFPG